MHIFRRTLLAMSLFGAASTPWSAALANEQTSDWNDFCHYVLIAKPDYAAGAAKNLNIDNIQAAQVLAAIEDAKSEVKLEKEIDSIFHRASNMPSVKVEAAKLYAKIKAARFAKARDPKRILANIKALTGMQRQARNATMRLIQAGQFAAPQLLATLENDDLRDLHAPAIKAMVQIGRPLVYPLSVSLKSVEASTQDQVLRILGQMGYPRALPYVKELLEDKNTPKGVKETAQETINIIVAKNHLKDTGNASELYLKLANDFYRKGTTQALKVQGIDPNNGKGQVWVYEPNVGLVTIEVPGAVFADVLAMRAASASLKLNQDQSLALTTLLMSNKRRENRLDGQKDDSYTLPFDPSYYLLASGPEHQASILKRALKDGDTQLAIDAIDAMTNTTGRKVFESSAAAALPLIQALNYPDRKVRFDATIAIAKLRPTKKFQSSDRIVQSLSEAVRQSNQKFALVITQNGKARTGLRNVLSDLGYAAIFHKTLAEAQKDIKATAGIDLLVSTLPTASSRSLVNQARKNYRISSTPILLLGDLQANTVFESMYRENNLVSTAVLPLSNFSQLTKAIESAVSATAGKPISSEESQAYVLEALKLLRDITLTSSSVFNIADAQAAVSAAVNDKRDEVAVAASQVLSLINNKAAQNTLYQAAFDTTRDDELRLAFLASLTESVNLNGNKLTAYQQSEALKLVKTSKGDFAKAAAKLHGALGLPTQNVKQLLTK